jgi:H+/Cl- antiporter ClcA
LRLGYNLRVERLRAHLVARVRVVVHLVRWILLGSASGALAGLASWVFLESLDHITRTRLDHGWIIWLLPLAALVVGFVYHRWGGRSAGGNALLLEEIHTPTAWVPRRMAPLVFGGTLVAHLFGASVGREGTALQMSGSLTDLLARTLRLSPADRRLLLIAALAGGFGSVFGVPLAGAVFAMEVQAIGRVRYEALVPALAASIVGDLVVSGLGYEHPLRPPLDLPVDGVLLAKVAAAGLAFGLASTLFTALAHGIKGLVARIGWPPLRPAVGGLATLALVALVGRDYLGLSLPIVDATLAGHSPDTWAFALKLVFTAIALGCGIPGGEVTPLFVIGAALGGTLAAPLGRPVATLGSIGFVAVFAGAANTPLACTIMGAELFGSGSVVAMAVGCVVAYVFSSHRGIYSTQLVDTPKAGRGGRG